MRRSLIPVGGSLLVLSIVWGGAAARMQQQAQITGELKQWHKVTLTVDGPLARETDTEPNPFLDFRMTVVFTHESGAPRYRVPGYFAADGRAGETSASSGNKWRAHLAPDKPGRWDYEVTLVSGARVAVEEPAAEPVRGHGGPRHWAGTFVVASSDKAGRDFRAHGRLHDVGRRHLRFAGSKAFFLKAGADSPENLLGYADFDGTRSAKTVGTTRANEAATTALKTWAPHLRDWRQGDPAWKDGRGKGLVGALNYLAGTGVNAVSFLTYNAGGDGDDVWPFVERDDKLHYDCSKLDQWQVVFDHAQALGLFLHFKLQETENDDTIREDRAAAPTALDAGDLGVERRLYLRELVARFGYELALNWNLGEENTQTPDQQRAMARFLRDTDPYPHPIVVHTYPDQQDKVYVPLLGAQSGLSGISLQNSWRTVHQRVLKWIAASEKAGRPWVVSNDEQNPHFTGVPPDPGYEGHDGVARPESGSPPYTLHDVRKHTLWGALLAGGAGVEYYFGYTLPQNDLGCQDWRSRERSWGYCRVALDFFSGHRVPFEEMANHDELVGNPAHDNSRYCLARPGDVYVVYLPEGGTTTLDTGPGKADFSVRWYDPRRGGPLMAGSLASVTGPGPVELGLPPREAGDDWVILVKRQGGDRE